MTPPAAPLVVVAYDTSSNRLRARLARLLDGVGTRVQWSVYECRLHPAEHRRLLSRLEALLPDPTDPAAPTCVVRLYALGALDARVVRLGGGLPVTPDDTCIVA